MAAVSITGFERGGRGHKPSDAERLGTKKGQENRVSLKKPLEETVLLIRIQPLRLIQTADYKTLRQ